MNIGLRESYFSLVNNLFRSSDIFWVSEYLGTEIEKWKLLDEPDIRVKWDMEQIIH
jgi:hypothetical protein